jgi:hypothetical protein
MSAELAGMEKNLHQFVLKIKKQQPSNDSGGVTTSLKPRGGED